MNFFVPPGGFAGFSQMTPASKRALTPMGSMRATGRRKRKSATKAKRRTGGKAKGRKLKFGSPAWRKKYAAKAKRNAKKARRK